MIISAETVRFDDDTIWVAPTDGRTLGVALGWFPRFLGASVEQRRAVEIGPFGLHWEALDEDVSVEGLLAGQGDRMVPRGKVA